MVVKSPEDAKGCDTALSFRCERCRRYFVCWHRTKAWFGFSPMSSMIRNYLGDPANWTPLLLRDCQCCLWWLGPVRESALGISGRRGPAVRDCVDNFFGKAVHKLRIRMSA